MARIQFDIVKVVKPPKQTIIKEKPHVAKVINSKYVVLVKTLRKLDIGDYVIVWKRVESMWLRSRMANVRYSLKKHLPTSHTHTYEIHSMEIPKVEGEEQLYDIIVKRIS